MNAPIALFVYNRPLHTEQTLNALMQNDLATDSILYIYCDGPNKDISLEEKSKIEEVRFIARKKKWCKKIIIKESENNLGLAKSVIKGVSEVLNIHERIIVLEDDIVTSKSFLTFMNKGLDLYKNDKKVYGISGYCFPYNGIIKKSTFFLPIMSSWGYAIWLDRWEEINFNGLELLEKINSRGLQKKLNFGKLNFYQMLLDQVNKKNDSWAIRFYVSMFLKEGYFLYPNESLIQNIGLDGSGIHCVIDESNLISPLLNKNISICLKKSVIELNENIIKKFISEKNKVNYKKHFKKQLKRFIAPEIIKLLKRKFNYLNKSKTSDLSSIPRYTEVKTELIGHEILIPDNASYLFMKKEIFNEEIYNFNNENSQPYIIDGGANIGLASIYFKLKYPNSNIIAFEPDEKIYNILQFNIKSFNLKKIKLINKGLWNENTKLSFKSEGADGGLISDVNNQTLSDCVVEVLSLKPFLNKKVDFLKLDIEGAETTVLKDIRSELNLVDRIFVEYHSFIAQEQTLNEIIDILTKAKFRLHISSPGLTSKSPFVNISTYNNMDMQLNIYGYKED